MGTLSKMPETGKFTSVAGFAVTVRAASISQVVALATAADAAAMMRATREIIDSCAEIDGQPGIQPSDLLTVQDGQKVVRLAQGGEADFT